MGWGDESEGVRGEGRGGGRWKEGRGGRSGGFGGDGDLGMDEFGRTEEVEEMAGRRKEERGREGGKPRRRGRVSFVVLVPLSVLLPSFRVERSGVGELTS